MKSSQLSVLVTGANGFVGHHLVSALDDTNMIVRKVVRNSPPRPDIFSVQTIGLQTDWRGAFAEIDAVVHLAGRAHHPNEDDATEIHNSINKDGTLHLARCAAEAGVRRFIFLSTILVNGSTTDGRLPFHQDDRPAPRGAYGASKAAAEEGLRIIATETHMDITIIRTPLIYGKGASGNFKLLVAAVKHGFPLPFGSIVNKRSFLGIENLSSFILHCLNHPGTAFDVFLLADNEVISTPEFVRRIAKALGKKSCLVPFPLAAIRAMNKLSRRPQLTDSVAGSMQIDISKALSGGWRHPLTLDEGLRSALIEQSN